MADISIISEQAAAKRLGIPRATLRYYRVRNYLPVGLVIEPESGTFQGRTSPVSYDVALVEKIATGEAELFPAKEEPEPAKPVLVIVPTEPEPGGPAE